MMTGSETIKLVIVGLLLTAGVYTDLRSRKVPNKMLLVVLAFFVGLIPVLDGWSGYLSAGLSALAAFVAVLPLYLIRAIGGGDVKLFTIASLLLSWQVSLIALFASLVWGSVLGVAMILTKQDWKSFSVNMTSLALRNPVAKEKLHKVPFTVAIFFGFLSALAIQGVL